MSPSAPSAVLTASKTNNPQEIFNFPLSPSNSNESLLNPQTYEKVSVEEKIFDKISCLSLNKYYYKDFEDIKPFYVCDIGELKRQLDLWYHYLPLVKPYYAVKCNPNLELIKNMINLNLGFDCASKNEIELVFNAYKDLGITNFDKENLIYANPIKPINQLKFANFSDVNLTTVDSIEEVVKIAEFTNGNMNVLIRITTDDSTATCPLSVKFGADLNYCERIIDMCIEKRINIEGIAFHAGSGFKDSKTLIKAINDSKKIWDYINLKQLKKCEILDIGGGFSKDSFSESAIILNEKLNSVFKNEILNNEIKIISELGRFLSESCFTLVTNVIGVRRELDNNKIRIYLNDGLYGNLNCILYDHQEVEPIIVTSNREFVLNKFNSFENPNIYSIWGPTCDGLDCIKSKCELEFDVKCGDFIAFKNAGAYTNAAATTFNGFTNDFEYLYVNTEMI